MRILICVAWPNASGPRHLGHAAGCYLPADVVARYHRLAGDDVLVVSGSDCHGTPVTVAAEAAGVEPSAFAAQQHEAIATTFARLGLRYDVYTTTTTANHETVVHEVFGRLRDNGCIEEGEQLSAWCTSEGRSLPDRYVEGGCPHCGATDARGDQCDRCGHTLDPADLVRPRCTRCGAEATLKPLRQLFVRLDLLQPSVERFLESREAQREAERSADPYRWRPFVLSEALGWVREGLKQRAITRDLDHGVRVPLHGWDDRRLYVWFEDVIGYVSATREADPDGWRTWWDDAGSLHRYFIGKDNIPFHAVWWPALLAGAGLAHLPDDVVANHYLTLGEVQMSASRGHGFTIDDAIDRLGVDPLRHALVALNPETQDVAFTFEQANDLTRTGLLGDIANPAYRLATLVAKRFGGRLAPAPDALGAAGEQLDAIGAAYRRAELRRALGGVHELGRHINRTLASTEPWHLDDAEARPVLASLVPFADALGVAAWPVVPSTAARIRKLLGRTPEPSSWSIGPEPVRIPLDPERPLREDG